MKKKLFWFIALLLLASLFLCACGGKTSPTETKPTDMAEQAVETTEQDVSPDPEWFSGDVIDEVIACLFPMEGEINVDLAQELLLPLLEIGNPEAQYYWGYICDLMIVDNCGEEEREALYWYELSAAQGYPKAYLAMALNTYIDSEERAAELVASAKQAGLFDMSPEELGSDGCEFIGSYYYSKENNYAEAADWYSKASEMGNSTGMINLGLMYFSGIGVPQDYFTAKDLLSKAANMGNVYAMTYYGLFLSHDDFAVAILEDAYTSALTENLEAANAGNADAMYKIGNMYYFGYRNQIFTDPWYETKAQNLRAAFEWYQKAAEAGHTDAMYIIGRAYLYGNSDAGLDVDYEKAIKWLQKAADKDHPSALFFLSEMYSDGKGVEQNETTAQKLYNKSYEMYNNANREMFYSDYGMVLKTAMEWHKKAAEAGSAKSMNALGYYSSWGEGYFWGDLTTPLVPPPELTEIAAIEWFQKAADAGFATAMSNLAYMYQFWEDYDTAMKWFIKAYVNGYEDAEAEIEKMLTNKQGVNGYFENYEELVLVNSYASP